MKKSLLLDLILLLIIFVIGFGSKVLVVKNLGNYDMIGPDPYLLYRYAKELYDYGKILYPDCMRYYPLCSGIDKYHLISYAGYLNAILMNNPLYFSFILKLSSLFNVVPKATQLFDIAIHYTPPILFGIAAIIMFLLLTKLFKDKLKSFLLTLIFTVSPAVTYRVIMFEKETIATPFILLAFLFYIYGIAEPKKRKIYYFLSGLATIGAMLSWGGWVIIPIVIGLYEFVNFLIKDKPNYDFVYSLFYILVYLYQINFNILLYLKQFAFAFINITILLHIFYILFEKYKIFEKLIRIENIISLKLKIDRELSRKLILLGLIILLASPIILQKLYYILSNPWETRFGSSVAEQQPSTPSQYVGMLTQMGLALSTLGLIYILYRWNKTNKNLVISIILSVLFMYIVVLSGTHVIFSWLAFFALLLYIVIKRQVRDEDLFILVWSLISFVLGDYINRLIFYTGYVLPILAGYAINFIEDLISMLKASKRIFEELIMILLALPTINGINIYMATKQFVFLIPLFIFGLLFYKVFIRKVSLEYSKTIGISILMLLLFGIPNVVYGYFIHFLDSAAMGGTEWYLIDGMEHFKSVSSKDALISFWWDYGYYAQTIANRTTWLDGGNAIVYWNHLMGRYGLCGNESEALDLMYIHSVYNFKTYRVLEFLHENNKVFPKIYKKLGLSDEDYKTIEEIKAKLGKKYIDLLYSINKSDEYLMSNYNLTQKEIKVIRKLENISYKRPMYYMIHPTDIGKFYQFSKIGSNDYYDKLSWISIFTSALILSREDYSRLMLPNVARFIGDKILAVLANNNTLTYIGEFPLDQDLYINATRIPRCVPEIGINTCGRIVHVDVEFSQPIVKEEGLQKTLEINNIINSNITKAYVYIQYKNKIYKVPLGCVRFLDKLYTFKNATYKGCLYVAPTISLIQRNINEGLFSNAYFISEKAMNYIWVKLYFFENSTHFTKIYDSSTKLFGHPLLTTDLPPLKIWEVKLGNRNIPEYKYCLYLARNLKEINMCAERYNLNKTFKTIWEV